MHTEQTPKHLTIAVTRARPDLAPEYVELDFSARENATSDLATVRRLIAAGARLLCAPAAVLNQLTDERNTDQ